MTQAQNLPARAQERVPVSAGGAVAALIPQNMEEAFRVANAISKSGLAPRGMDKPETILVAIMAGAELGMAPFQSLQSIAVVNGRPTLWGDGLMAIARSQGIKAEERLEGRDEQMVAHCKVTRPDNGEVVERSFTVAQAKKAGLWGKQGPWQQYPERMLQMRARAWALRDGCADFLRGFQVREEVEDFQHIREVAPQPTGMRARLEARKSEGGFDPEFVASELDGIAQPQEEAQDADFEPAGDDAPADGDPPASDDPDAAEDQLAEDGAPTADLAGEDFDAMDWGASFNRGLASLNTVEEVARAWEDAKAKGYVFKLKAASEAMAKQLAEAVNARIGEIKAGAADA